ESSLAPAPSPISDNERITELSAPPHHIGGILALKVDGTGITVDQQVKSLILAQILRKKDGNLAQYLELKGNAFDVETYPQLTLKLSGTIYRQPELLATLWRQLLDMEITASDLERAKEAIQIKLDEQLPKTAYDFLDRQLSSALGRTDFSMPLVQEQ